MAQEFKLRLRFSGNTVDRYGLDLYDGTYSLQGFAQALQIVMHAGLNRQIVSRATALRNARIAILPPVRGSVLFDLITIIEQYPATSAMAGAAFYDFIKYSLSRAVGYFNVRPETPAVRRLTVGDNETFFDELAETLEGSLLRAHRAIDQGVARITIERPRSQLVLFDAGTNEWVKTRDENPNVQEFTGNITRYNSISKNGRAFIREIGSIVPFRPGDDFPANKRGFLTWSLHGDNVHAEKDLKFWARRIESANGQTKRLILADTAAAE